MGLWCNVKWNNINSVLVHYIQHNNADYMAPPDTAYILYSRYQHTLYVHKYIHYTNRMGVIM